MGGGAWWAAVHGVAKSRTQLSDFPFTFHFHALEKEIATHCRVLAWRIPGTGEPDWLQSMGSHRVGHDWSELAAAAAAISKAITLIYVLFLFIMFVLPDVSSFFILIINTWTSKKSCWVKMSFPKDYMMCDSIHTIPMKWQNCRNGKQISSCHGLRGW